MLGGTVVGAAANFLLAAVLGNGLGPAGTGTFFAVVGAFAVASNVLELGADTGLIRALPRQVALGRRGEVGPTIWLALLPVVLVGGLVAWGVWAWADQLASHLGSPADAAQRAEAFSFLAPLILAASLLAVLLGGTRGLGGVLPVVLILNVSLPVARLVLISALIATGAGVVTLLQWWALTVPAATLVAGVILYRMWRTSRASQSFSTKDSRRLTALAREFWGFSIPRGAAAAIEIVLEWIDVLIVAVLLSPREAGIYAVVTRIVRVGQLVEHAARVTVAPLVSAMAAMGEMTRLNALYEGVTRALVALAMPFYVTVIVFAPTLLNLFGEGFAEGSTALRIAATGMGLALCAGALQSVILMVGRGSWQLGNKATALVTSVILLIALVPLWGIEGAATAWVSAIAVDTARAAIQARRIGVRLRSNETLLLLLAAIVLVGGGGALVSVLVPGLLGLAVHVLLAGVAYAGWIWWRRDRIREISSAGDAETLYPEGGRDSGDLTVERPRL